MTIWTEHLSDAQLKMIQESGEQDQYSGYGVEIRGAGRWRTAGALVAKGLGSIEGGEPNGSTLPGLYFNGEEAIRILHEFDDEDEEDGFGCPLCGLHREHSHGVA